MAKFRIVAADVVIIPDVTKKAEPATRDEFTKMIEGQDIDQSELMEEKEKTNRYVTSRGSPYWVVIGTQFVLI